jgi:hypothetical protein
MQSKRKETEKHGTDLLERFALTRNQTPSLCVFGKLRAIEKVSKVELGHMTVRIGDVSRTIICYDKMLLKDEQTLTNKKCLP